jgi:hypothetical protein
MEPTPSSSSSSAEGRIAALRLSMQVRRGLELDRVVRIRGNLNVQRDMLLAKLRAPAADGEEIAEAAHAFSEHHELLAREQEEMVASATASALAVHAEMSRELLRASLPETSCAASDATSERSEQVFASPVSPAASGFTTPSVDRILRAELLDATSALAYESSQLHAALAEGSEMRSKLECEMEASLRLRAESTTQLSELTSVRAARHTDSEKFLEENSSLESQLQHVRTELATCSELQTESATSSKEYTKLATEYMAATTANAALREECNVHLTSNDPVDAFMKDLHRMAAAGEITTEEELRLIEVFDRENQSEHSAAKSEDIEAPHDHVRAPPPTLPSTCSILTSHPYV